jgi:16S rRNA (cytidine1402-2'-O)-methyltransferase
VSNLYIVSTPIGHLGDFSYRAVEVLKRVQRVLAEDTRRTKILFRRYGIEKPLVSAHAHNEKARIAAVLSWLAAGDEVALVSDAGTPLVSDPGARIVAAVVSAGHRVVPVPGASALLAALVAAGLETEPFSFYGFVPKSGRARQRILAEVWALRHTVVLYEAPGRLVRLLTDLVATCGATRRVVVAREMTKVHEAFFRGTLAEAAAYYEVEPARGEIVVLLAGASDAEVPADASNEAATAVVRKLLESGRQPSAVAREAAKRLGIPRTEAYRIALSLTASAEE